MTRGYTTIILVSYGLTTRFPVLDKITE